VKEAGGARIQQLEKQFELPLTLRQVETSLQYVTLLRHWGQSINLAGPAVLRDPFPHLFEAFWACQQGFVSQTRIVDVGSGAGLPGLAFLLYRPELRVTLIEPNFKKALFLKEAGRQLGLDVTVQQSGYQDFRQWEKGLMMTLRGFRPVPELLAKVAKAALSWLWFHGPESELEFPGFRSQRQALIPGSRRRRLTLFRADSL